MPNFVTRTLAELLLAAFRIGAIMLYIHIADLDVSSDVVYTIAMAVALCTTLPAELDR